MFKKLLSRKLWAAILNALLIIANKKYNIGLTPVELGAITTGAVAYIGAQAYIDSKTL